MKRIFKNTLFLKKKKICKCKCEYEIYFFYVYVPSLLYYYIF